MRPHKLFSPLLLASGLAALSCGTAMAQEKHNTTEQIDGTWASGATTVEFGPQADITINGNWYLTANTVTIDPAAKIGGTGTLHIMTPETYGNTAVATTINAGGATNPITCKVSLENGNTILLAGSNDLVMGNNLAFAKTGAHLVLGAARSLQFTAAAAAIATATVPTVPVEGAFSNQPVDATADFRNAYAVTNGAGNVSKVAVIGTFTFPVGFTANTGTNSDYTPATVINTAATRDLSARVQDYATSTPTEGNATKGVNRTWQIVGSAAGTATVALTSNTGTEGAAFTRNAAFVTQGGASSFSVGTPTTATLPNYTHTGTFTVPATGDATSYFSKSSDGTNSLNSFIAVSPKVFLQGAGYNSGTGLMTNALRTANLIPLAQPYNIAAFGNYAGLESVVDLATIPATTTDWVLVELRNGSNVVVATRAGLLKNTGDVTDIDGTSPLSFRGTAPGNYSVAIRHRNHLAIRTAAPLTFTQDGAVAYDFTTSQAQAYQNAAVTTNDAMAATSAGGKFAMWGGNANMNNNVRFAGLANDAATIVSAIGGTQSTIVSNVYNASDLNMNGNVKYTGLSNDAATLISVLGGIQSKIITQH